MTMQATKEWKLRLMLAAAMALLSPATLSAEAMPAGEQEVIVVTGQRVVAEVRQTKIEVDLHGLIDSIDRRIADDQAKDLEAIGNRGIQLAIQEVPTRG